MYGSTSHGFHVADELLYATLFAGMQEDAAIAKLRRITVFCAHGTASPL